MAKDFIAMLRQGGNGTYIITVPKAFVERNQLETSETYDWSCQLNRD
jgi:hypothetical protein